MRKTLMLARREYRAAVRTKGFIISLILAPVLMGGSALGMLLFENQVDTADKKVAIVDRSGVAAEALVAAAAQRNETEIRDEETGEQVKPAYRFEIVPPDASDPARQRLELSDQVRSRELHAFLDIGPDVLHPGEDPERNRITYHAENAALDEIRGWLGWPINNHLRRTRVLELGVAEEAIADLFSWTNPEGMGLVSVDLETGEIREARRSSEGEAILVPLILVMLMFMMVMMGAMPLLSAVMEEKTQRIAEVLLGSLKPFEFMMGKVLGGLAVSLTCSAVYVVAGIFAVRQAGIEEMIPFHLLPWFFTFMVLAILMEGSILAAFGSACNDAKEAQAVTFPAMAPIFIPMFILVPVIQQPLNTLATGLSFIPPFTPMLMLVRMAAPVQIPAWQPWVGLVGVLIFTVLAIWGGGRIFRIAILMQGTPPRLGKLLKWVVRG